MSSEEKLPYIAAIISITKGMVRTSAAVLLLSGYLYLLFKVMVLKDIPVIRVGDMRFKIGGPDDGPPNWVPFKTIRNYLMGKFGWAKAGLNLVGNVALLVPVGFLASVIHPRMTWWQSLAIGLAVSFSIEAVQHVSRLGIFDIDDILLNTLGVLLGHGIHLWLRRGWNAGTRSPLP